MKNIVKNTLGKSMLITGLIFSTLTFSQTTTANSSVVPTAVGTSKNWGSVDGISMIGLVQGPSSAEAQLQVACVFEYTDNDIPQCSGIARQSERVGTFG